MQLISVIGKHTFHRARSVSRFGAALGSYGVGGLRSVCVCVVWIVEIDWQQQARVHPFIRIHSRTVRANGNGCWDRRDCIVKSTQE